MHNNDGLTRQRNARVRFGDSRIIPRRDFSEVDSGDDFGGELQLAFEPRNVVRGNDCSQHRGQVNDFLLGIGQLLI